MANRHEESVKGLLSSGLLPPSNIVHGRAETALMAEGALGNDKIKFSCLYLDACGGQTSPLIDMIRGALGGDLGGQGAMGGDRKMPGSTRMAIGFSILGGGSDARNVVDKEMEVVRVCVKLAAERGLAVSHVGDDPGRYGVSEHMRKVEGGTFSTWLALQAL